MKVCILTERMKIGFGVDLVVDEQAKRLTRRGFDVVVIAIHADLDQPAHEYTLVVIDKYVFRPDYGNEGSMRKFLQKYGVADADIYLIHTAPFYEWINWLDAPVIAMEHGTPPGRFFRDDIGRAVDAYAAHRVQTLFAHLQKFDSIISISRSIHEWLPRHLQDISQIIYNGGDHYQDVSANATSKLRSSLGVGEDGVLALWLGRMQLEDDDQPYKNFPRVQSIASKVISSVPNCTFVLAGRVSARDAAVLRGQGLKVLANLSSEEISVALAAADVFVNLSRWEGFNLALVEAQYLGTPVVAYDIGPHPEVVITGKTGLLVSNEDDLVEATVRILMDVKFRSRLSDRARDFARGFTWEKHTDDLIRLINELVEHAPKGAAISAMRRERRRDLISGATIPSKERRTILSIGHLVTILRSTRESSIRSLRNKDLTIDDWMTINKSDFVRLAFHALLGRTAEDEAVVGYTQRLRDGESRATILADIRFSAEGLKRSLNDPAILAVLSERVPTDLLRDPRLLVSDTDKSLASVAEELQQVQLSLHTFRLEAFSEITALKKQSQLLNERLEHFSAHEDNILGSFGRRPDMFTGYTMLLAAGAHVSEGRLAKAFSTISSCTSDIIFGDHVEIRPDGDDRLTVNGPLDRLSFGSEVSLGYCVLVRDSMLARLRIDRFSKLTEEVIEALFINCCSITYMPIVFAEKTTYADVDLRRRNGLDFGDGGLSLKSTKRASPHFDTSEAVVLLLALNQEDVNRLLRDDAVPMIVDAYGGVVLLLREGAGGPSDSDLMVRFGPKLVIKYLNVDDNDAAGLNESLRSLQSEYKLFIVSELEHALSLLTICASLADIALMPDVGIVSPLFRRRNGRIVDAGLSIDAQGAFFHPAGGHEGGDRIAYNRLGHVRQVMAMPKGLWVFRSEIYQIVGGFDETLDFDVAFVDFCLNVQSFGLTVVVDGRSPAIVERDGLRSLNLDATNHLTLVARYPFWVASPDRFWIERDIDHVPIVMRHITAFSPKLHIEPSSDNQPKIA